MVARSMIFYWLSLVRVNMPMCQIIDRTFLHTLSQNDFLEMIFACTFSGFDQIPLFSIQLQERKKVSSSAPSKMTKMIQRGLTVKKTGRPSWFRLFRSWISSTAFFKS